MMIREQEDPVIHEVTATLHEWHKIWIALYLNDQEEIFERIGNTILELFDLRTELIQLLKQLPDATGGGAGNGCEPNRDQQIISLKNDIVNKIDSGDRLLDLDLIPRDKSSNNFKPVDPIAMSPIKLFRLHSETIFDQQQESSIDDVHSTSSNIFNLNQESVYNGAISISSASSIYSEFNTASSVTSNDSSTYRSNQTSSYHLQMNLLSHQLTALPTDELVEIYFSIVDVHSNNNNSYISNGNPANSFTPISEKFLVQINGEEIIYGVPNTIFTNIGNLQQNNRDLCLYIQVYRVGKMTLIDGYKTAFSKQQSSHSIQSTTSVSNLNGSTNSVNSTAKHNSGASFNRHSTLHHYNPTPKYRRPIGCTMVLLKDHVKYNNFKESCVKVKVVAASNESEFSQIQDLYFKRNLTLKPNQNLPNIQLDLAIKPLLCPQRSIPRILSLCLTEKRGFPDIVMPGDFKNDLFFTLESAEFEKGGKSISKNIEASISLIDKSGLIIENCISPASNCDKISSHNSCVFYHSNSPKWNESIKINVPLSEFDSAHIRIEFKHCSTKEREKKFLGFSFLPLSDEDGTVIADKSHELYLYKCDPQLWEDEPLNLCKYTSLPYGPNTKTQLSSNNTSSANKLSNFTHSNREIVTVSTFLLSTKLTQNSDLLNLLKWRELIKRDNKDFEDALNRVLVLKGEEIVKFLQDILDTLFDTFTLFSTSEDDKSALIFKVLVHIFLLLEEPKFQHFKPVLDTYASAHFSATLVYKGLLACVKKCLEYSSDVKCHLAIQRCFRSIKHVFKFIVQSKLLFSTATGEQNDEPFVNDLRYLFKLFERMLANSNPNLISIQVTFLESFPGTLEHLIKVISPQELAKVVASLAASVGWLRLAPTLSRAKLIFMRETANSVLIKNKDVRCMITEDFCKHLDYYLKHLEELKSCHEVLEILIVKIHDSYWPSIYRLHQLSNKSHETKASVNTVGEIHMLTKTSQSSQLVVSVARELEPFVNLLDPLLHLLDVMIKDFSADRLLVQKYCTCLLTILKLMSKTSFEQFMKRCKIDYTKLSSLFGSFRSIYNRDCSIMQITSHSILEHPIEELYRDIRVNNDSSSLNRSYIRLLIDFITHPTLQLETFSSRKKNYILMVFGDLRLKFSTQLLRFWKSLNKTSICDLIPTSIQSILDATLLPNDEIQHMLMPIFYDMLNSEDQLKSNSRQIERCLIDCLDLFFNLDRGNSKFVDNFELILLRMIDQNSPTWKQNGISFVKSFSKLMRLLIEYRTSSEISENRSKRMSCLVDLLNFYRDQDRIDLHLKYLFRLCDMHVEVANYVEAAFTLKLYTDELRWCSRNLNPIEDSIGSKRLEFRPEEIEWKRKEALYLRMIHYFDLGKCWEEAIGLCKELASFYENYLVDYEKVSSTLKRLASFLDNILTELRPEREYFRVEFVGSDLPSYVKDKEFVYRGGEYERLAAFIQRMTNEFPIAQVLNSKTRLSITKDTAGQYMIISNVKPVPCLQEQFKSGQRNINDKIMHYYLNNRIDTFSYDKPIMKGVGSNSTEPGEINVKNLWIGRYLLKSKKHLPDILPWSEVITQDYNEISPINHAIETITNMNLELSKLILSYKTEPNKQISPLTMRLQGVIEAAVNGGPSVFVNAFLKRQSGEPIDNQLEPPDLLLRLRDLIKQQYSILETGLTLHSKLAPPEVMPLHARLVERLQSTR